MRFGRRAGRGTRIAVGLLTIVLMPILVWRHTRDYWTDAGVVYVKVTNRTNQPLTRGTLRLDDGPSGRALFDSLASGGTWERRLVPRMDGPTCVEFLQDGSLVRSSWAGDLSHGSPLRIKVAVFDDRVEVSHTYR